MVGPRPIQGGVRLPNGPARATQRWLSLFLSTPIDIDQERAGRQVRQELPRQQRVLPSGPHRAVVVGVRRRLHPRAGRVRREPDLSLTKYLPHDWQWGRAAVERHALPPPGLPEWPRVPGPKRPSSRAGADVLRSSGRGKGRGLRPAPRCQIRRDPEDSTGDSTESQISPISHMPLGLAMRFPHGD